MELNPSGVVTNCVATQELHSILWNSNVRYSVYKSQPLASIPSQIDPVHTPQPISLRTILILSTTYVLVFPVVSLLLSFPPMPYMYSSSPPFVLQIPPISASLDLIILIILAEEYKL
jgi:hypothetical protein